MPNHCENDLYVSGKREDVAAFLAFVGADQSPPRFDFNAILPYPADLAARDADYPDWREGGEVRAQKMAAYVEKYGTEKNGYNDGGYEWCNEHWGTKWNAYEVVRRDYGPACITFQTAWAPPLPVIKALAEKFPTVTLHLEFFERGMCFCGGVTYYSAQGVADGLDRLSEWRFNGYRGHRGG